MAKIGMWEYEGPGARLLINFCFCTPRTHIRILQLGTRLISIILFCQVQTSQRDSFSKVCACSATHICEGLVLER